MRGHPVTIDRMTTGISNMSIRRFQLREYLSYGGVGDLSYLRSTTARYATTGKRKTRARVRQVGREISNNASSELNVESLADPFPFLLCYT